MRFRSVCVGAFVTSIAFVGMAQQRWLAPGAGGLATDGRVADYALPHANSGPTTIALAADGTVWFTREQRQSHRPHESRRHGARRVRRANRRTARRASSRVGADGNLWFSEHLAGQMARITPQRRNHGVRNPDAGQSAACDRARRRRQHLVRHVRGRQDRPRHAGRRHHGVRDLPTPFSGPRALAAGPDGNIWFSEFHASKIGRITMAGAITEFPLAAPEFRPRRHHGRRRRQHVVRRVERHDRRASRDAATAWAASRCRARSRSSIFRARTARRPTSRSAPIATSGTRRAPSLGRVTPEGVITEFPLAASARGVGLTAGSDRQPPARLANRLWYADGNGNKIGYLHFE